MRNHCDDAGPRPAWAPNTAREPSRVERPGRIGYKNDSQRQQAQRKHQPELQQLYNRES